MSQLDQFDNYNSEGNETSAVSDTYTVESSADIYNTPDISGDPLNENPAEETVEADVVSEDTPAASLEVEPEADTAGGGVEAENSVPQENYVDDPMTNPYGMSGNNNTYYSDPYANNPYVAQNNNSYVGQTAQNNDPYNNNPYGNGTYVGQNVQNNNQYNGQTVPSENPYNSNLYGNSTYVGQSAQNNNQYNGQTVPNDNPYNSNPYGNSPYIGQNVQNSNQYNGQTVSNDNPYNSNPYGNGPYVGQSAQNNGQYNGQTAQRDNRYVNYNQPNSNQYGNPPYGNNQYSPYAVPPKKNNTGLIIGIVVAVIILFLIAFGALTYKVVSLYSDEKDNKRSAREEYDFDDDWDKDRDRKDDDRYQDDDDYDDYDYDYDDDDYVYDDYDYDYNYDDDEYYTLHDDIKSGLSYSVDFDYYEYDTDYEHVDIIVFYPIISSSGDDIPNLDKLNSTIQSEIDFLVDYFEEEYEEYFDDDDSYFQASSTGYVTYMDEEKMSIVFSENVYSDYYNDVFLYSINIDMENGVILDNESMLNVNDDFSVEFREKSDVQNGEISYLTKMSDQEITDHFDSSDIIVFYTPQGMEIGFNYDEGWVTVTYKDYEQYLKVF